jgi:hypothetical protein
MSREPDDLPNRESCIRSDRPPVAQRVMEAADQIMVRDACGEEIDPRLLEWAAFIVMANR